MTKIKTEGKKNKENLKGPKATKKWENEVLKMKEYVSYTSTKVTIIRIFTTVRTSNLT
jgi:hypothetical protein